MIYNPCSYANILKLINDKDYAKNKHIIVKKMENLIILKYDKKMLNLNNVNTLGLFRSIIVNENGEILCFAPPKSIDFDVFSQSNNYDDCKVQLFKEGTMINVFYDNSIDDWRISTRSTLGAKCNFNMDSNLTYRFMFLDAMNYLGMEFYHLKKDLCYSFVLQHPENRIVEPISRPNITLTNIYKICKNMDINKQYIETIKNEIINEDLFFEITNEYKMNSVNELFEKFKYKGENWENLMEHFYSDNLDYNLQGLVIYNSIGERTKIRNKNYEKIKHLKGNSPKLQYQYYALRQSGLVKEFLNYYPENKNAFYEFRSELHAWTNQLYKNYISCFIKKEKKLSEYPYNYKTHMYNIHQIYLMELRLERKYVNKEVVIEYVNNLPPPRLMYSVNHIKKQFNIEKKVITSDLKVLINKN